MTAFKLTNGAVGVSLSATSTSSRAAIVGNGDTLVVSNPGDKWAYLVLGNSTVTATTSGYPIPPGTQQDFLLDDGAAYATAPYAAAITSGSDTTTVLVHRGFR